MIDAALRIFKEKNILFHTNEDITIATIKNLHEGYLLAEEIVYSLVTPKTVLYLSGGSTPKILYEKFAKEEKLLPGAVGIVDERYGKPFHEKSNEKMIRETGFYRYLQMRDIPFYPILQGKSREQTAEAYDQKMRELTARYPKSLAILGIGNDGHTSSLAPNRKDFKNPMFSEERKQLFVSEFDDPQSFYGERVGMTFLGLSMIDILLVLVFGENKRDALSQLFSSGKEEDVPARFFKRPDIAKKTLFITDQRI